MRNKTLQNKIAIVTGSSRGIGRATALLFAQEGAKVVVNYVSSRKKALEVVSEIRKLGSEAIAVKCDISQENQVKAMIERVVKRFGRIDILVNNAGIVFDLPFSKRTTAQWQQTFNTNVLGTFLCSREAAPYMSNNEMGKIINIGSTSGIKGFSTASIDYDVSKAGMPALTRLLAKELAPKIRVNCVAPGWVNTEMNQELPEEYLEQEIENIYLKRMAEPEDVAKTILFFASENSDYITGSTLVVDGGTD